MGEIAEMMLNGTLCEGCGVFLGDAEGYPRYCASCSRSTADPTPKKKTRCKICKKLVSEVGLAQHIQAKHLELEK